MGVCTDAALGILRPDGTARPVADPLRAFAHELRGRPARIPPRWQQQRVDTPRTAEAFRTPESWLTNRTEIRPSGFGIETRRLQPVRLIPDASEGPWVELGAAWSRIEVEGKRVERAPAAPVRVPLRSRVKLTVLNTGTATWAPWTPQQDGARLVRIEARSAHEDPVLIRVPRLAAGEEGSTDWTPARPGHHRLRLSMPATGAWGEALDIEVIEPDE